MGAPRREIELVLADHALRLMAIPGVLGIHVSRQHHAPALCLKVLVDQKDPTATDRLPQILEGHPVVLEFVEPNRPFSS